MAESDEQKVLKVVALTARAQDSALSIPERVASLNDMCPLLRAASRGENAAAVAEKLFDLECVDFTCRALIDAGAYIALGDLKSCVDVTQAASFICARMACMMAMMDGWGSHSHPEWRHRWFDSAYGRIAVAGRKIAELLAGDEGAASDAVVQRTQEMVTLLNVEGGVGGPTANACMYIALSPHGLGGTAAKVIVTAGAYDTASASFREDDLSSADLYAHAIQAAMLATECMADAALTARLFESGVIEAAVARVQRAQTAETPVHVNVNRCTSQLLTGVATTEEGRAKLKATAGLEDALVWLLENGGDPIGIAENKTLADPRGMAGLCMALLRGREEDAQLALPGKVVRQIAAMVDTYHCFGAAMVLPYVQAFAELSVSDANKEHLKSVPGAVDSLRTCLGISSSGADQNAVKLRTFVCSTLVQLSTSELTLPLLLGHPILEDLEQVPSLPESSKDARNDAMAVLFAVRQHEKAEDGAASPRKSDSSADGQHVMISYEWSVQPVIKRIRDSLIRRGYRVWLDVRRQAFEQHCGFSSDSASTLCVCASLSLSLLLRRLNRCVGRRWT
eukprot:SAG11_NODE_70_length_18450_cov_14.704975_9_plen_566_part_00